MGVSKVNFGEETLVDLTDDTVSRESLLNGYTAHDKSGEKIVGTAIVPTKMSELENDADYGKTVELTQIEYDALGEEKNSNDTLYLIKDETPKIMYNGTEYSDVMNSETPIEKEPSKKLLYHNSNLNIDVGQQYDITIDDILNYDFIYIYIKGYNIADSCLFFLIKKDVKINSSVYSAVNFVDNKFYSIFQLGSFDGINKITVTSGAYNYTERIIREISIFGEKLKNCNL